ncbi:hypothetical protein HDU76_003110 [Blyttiomyces sp. JEL0837]|nr:hypothetical protein HDU76_003110 [Blyttiomyces sp. JEL0837]
MAAAYVSQSLNIPCRVYVPSTTPQLTRTRLAALGAEVVVSGDVWDQANEAAMAFVESANKSAGSKNGDAVVMVHPFDHELIWEGNSSVITESIQQASEELGISFSNKDSAVVCAVGGGGLINGVMKGLMSISESNRPTVVGVETEGAASFAAAVNADKIVKIPAITSIAKSLGALAVSEGVLRLRLEYGKDRVVSALVSDRQAVKAVMTFADDNRMLVEPSCAASLAIVYEEGGLKRAVPGLNEEQKSHDQQTFHSLS